MSGQGWICALCTGAPATSFCTCEDREIMLCDCCFLPHCRKAPLQPHIMLPLASFGQHKIPGYFERLQARTCKFEVAKVEILKNIEEVDRCIAEVSNGIEKIISEVRAYGCSQLAKLLELRAELEGAIKASISEVESTLYQDSAILVQPWASNIRSYDGEPESLRIFEFCVNSSAVLAILRLFCEYSMEGPRANVILPGIKGKTLRLYNIKAQRMRCLELTRSFSYGVRICYLSNAEFLLVGAEPASKTACTLNTSQSQVLEIQPMQVARRHPGLIAADKAAYVFGGDCSECEKLDIATKEWQQLPAMNGKVIALSPCRVQRDIYLLDVCYQTYEVFNLDSQVFHSLQLIVTSLSSNSLSVLVNEEIIIITCNNQIGYFRPGTTSISGYPISNIEGPVSQCQPVLFGKEVYYVSSLTGNVNSFNIETKAFARKD